MSEVIMRGCWWFYTLNSKLTERERGRGRERERERERERDLEICTKQNMFETFVFTHIRFFNFNFTSKHWL